VGADAAGPDLWGFCGDATAHETVVLDGAGPDDRGMLPGPPTGRPTKASLVSLARSCHGLAITDSDLGLVTFSAKCARIE
jgi:hypothetical protein